MLSLYKHILEVANVGPSSFPIAPFGPYNSSDRNNRILSKMQDLSTMDPSKQSDKMKKVLGVQ